MQIRQPVSLLPCHIGEPRLGIDQEMTALLMRYSDKLKGVILSFSNVKLQKPLGHIMNEQPYIHCKVVADALVFQPREGMTLEGVVNKIGSNHIGMLFAGVFNGSVAAAELPKGYVHNYAQDCWLAADGSSISVDDRVQVQVVRVHVAGGMIAIEATMRTGATKKKQPAAKASPKPKKLNLAKEEEPKKKTKAKKQQPKEVETEGVAAPKKRKSKQQQEEAPVEEDDKKHKKKKSKRSKTE
ncbi:hypothetical protein Poli38472_001355 [Pythium oligandrum]|uniref:DNA-directed RNA polymerase I subunit RPA43 n=1 Tax=Pythium oligandrum TaxID=41045 RepID=A0A8K1CTY9_PYTOL|nr:hypothetical protein Poli38472_001355 [Pythium oligandrum]|eukprot:TMW69199.1 hypothetical protein Poli38472_001355 [Pythium oligandrum]